MTKFVVLLMLIFAATAQCAELQVIEYYHADFDHYFVTADPGEIAQLDAGTFSGWVRTGHSFPAYALGGTGMASMCRFFSASFAPKSSHFYTPLADECAKVKTNPDWQFEGEVFAVALPDSNGFCGAGTVPVYRYYNNGQGGAPNHRYATGRFMRQTMIDAGWVPEGYGEGVIACVPQAISFVDGSHSIGKDIQPATYRTRDSAKGCYYARLRGFSGSLNDIITNDDTDAPAIVTIALTDAGFMSSRCGTWTQDLSAITAGQTSFADGMFIVGPDIQAKTYRTRVASSGCYFARLRGFSSELSDIIANNVTDAPSVVTIAATDSGFSSSRCGTWTQDLSPITNDKTSFGDGVFIVGTDLEAGTYHSTIVGSHCYYARLRGFSGELADIIVNNIVAAGASGMVAIQPSDAGIQSSGCGTWIKG